MYELMEKVCSICQSNFELNNDLVKLKCNDDHIFHEICIHEWFKEHNTCPLCRVILESKEKQLTPRKPKGSGQAIETSG
jgi:hypothetical protein